MNLLVVFLNLALKAVYFKINKKLGCLSNQVICQTSKGGNHCVFRRTCCKEESGCPVRTNSVYHLIT
nr:MAG TPA: hypothetical protein [Caudoviricetes sp.]